MSLLLRVSKQEAVAERRTVPSGYKRRVSASEELLDILTELAKKGFEVEIVKIRPLTLEEEMEESEKTGKVKLQTYTAVNVYAAVEEARKLSYKATAEALNVENELRERVHSEQALDILKRAGAVEVLAATKALSLSKSNPIRRVVELSMMVLTPAVAMFISQLVLKVVSGYELTEGEKTRLRDIEAKLRQLEEAIREVLEQCTNPRAAEYYRKMLRRVRYLLRVIEALLHERE